MLLPSDRRVEREMVELIEHQADRASFLKTKIHVKSRQKAKMKRKRKRGERKKLRVKERERERIEWKKKKRDESSRIERRGHVLVFQTIFTSFLSLPSFLFPHFLLSLSFYHKWLSSFFTKRQQKAFWFKLTTGSVPEDIRVGVTVGSCIKSESGVTKDRK